MAHEVSQQWMYGSNQEENVVIWLFKYLVCLAVSARWVCERLIKAQTSGMVGVSNHRALPPHAAVWEQTWDENDTSNVFIKRPGLSFARCFSRQEDATQCTSTCTRVTFRDEEQLTHVSRSWKTADVRVTGSSEFEARKGRNQNRCHRTRNSSGSRNGGNQVLSACAQGTVKRYRKCANRRGHWWHKTGYISRTTGPIEPKPPTRAAEYLAFLELFVSCWPVVPEISPSLYRTSSF